MSREKDAIKKMHTDWTGKAEGVLVFEMPTGTGYSHGEPNRIDAFHMEVHPSKGLKRTAYEIKVSRADFLREIREPRKRRAAMRVSNQFYFVTPPGVANVQEIPLDCGLLEVDGATVEIVAAPFRDSMPASWHFFAAFARRLQNLSALNIPAPKEANDVSLDKTVKLPCRLCDFAVYADDLEHGICSECREAV